MLQLLRKCRQRSFVILSKKNNIYKESKEKKFFFDKYVVLLVQKLKNLPKFFISFLAPTKKNNS